MIMTSRFIGIMSPFLVCCALLACAPRVLTTTDLEQAVANGVIDTSVAEIVQEYTDNELRVADTYESGRAIRISGNIGDIGAAGESDGRIIIILLGPTGFLDGVEAYLFPDARSDALKLNAGDVVTLLCAKSEGEAALEAVTLNGCLIE